GLEEFQPQTQEMEERENRHFAPAFQSASDEEELNGDRPEKEQVVTVEAGNPQLRRYDQEQQEAAGEDAGSGLLQAEGHEFQGIFTDAAPACFRLRCFTSYRC